VLSDEEAARVGVLTSLGVTMLLIALFFVFVVVVGTIWFIDLLKAVFPPIHGMTVHWNVPSGR